jgi:hypothetical protein
MAEVLVLQNFIDGQFVSAPKHIESFNPSTGKVKMNSPGPFAQSSDVRCTCMCPTAKLKMWTALLPPPLPPSQSQPRTTCSIDPF